uniref:Uncharacterized protein n=1 Tax=Leersia perrieri TaxID=77586 RepID=A0A0D9XJU0_9ORYZ
MAISCKADGGDVGAADEQRAKKGWRDRAMPIRPEEYTGGGMDSGGAAVALLPAVLDPTKSQFILKEKQNPLVEQ